MTSLSTVNPTATAEACEPLFLVQARDDVDPRLAGHAGTTYTSPPQPRSAALALVTLLLGAPLDASDDQRAWTVPVAGGRRSVTITPSSAA